MSEALVQLVQAAQNGDRQAFGELVARYRGRVYALAMALTADHDEAQELTQETFVRALKSLPRLSEPEKFHPWLRGITHTIGRDIKRKMARERKHAAAAAQERPERVEGGEVGLAQGEAVGRELQRLGDLVAELPENLRVALDLRFREGLSYAEIGEVMGVPASTVRGLLFRATKTLRTKMKPTIERTRGSEA